MVYPKKGMTFQQAPMIFEPPYVVWPGVRRKFTKSPAISRWGKTSDRNRIAPIRNPAAASDERSHDGTVVDVDRRSFDRRDIFHHRYLAGMRERNSPPLEVDSEPVDPMARQKIGRRFRSKKDRRDLENGTELPDDRFGKNPSVDRARRSPV